MGKQVLNLDAKAVLVGWLINHASDQSLTIIIQQAEAIVFFCPQDEVFALVSRRNFQLKDLDLFAAPGVAVKGH